MTLLTFELRTYVQTELFICIKMDLALNNLQRLICYKTQTNQNLVYYLLLFSVFLVRSIYLTRHQIRFDMKQFYCWRPLNTHVLQSQKMFDPILGRLRHQAINLTLLSRYCLEESFLGSGDKLTKTTWREFQVRICVLYLSILSGESIPQQFLNRNLIRKCSATFYFLNFIMIFH